MNTEKKRNPLAKKKLLQGAGKLQGAPPLKSRLPAREPEAKPAAEPKPTLNMADVGASAVKNVASAISPMAGPAMDAAKTAATPTSPAASENQPRSEAAPKLPNLGFTAFWDQQVGMSGSRRMNHRTNGGEYRSGPLKGMNKAMGYEKMRAKWASMSPEEKKQYEARANQDDILSAKEKRKINKYENGFSKYNEQVGGKPKGFEFSKKNKAPMRSKKKGPLPQLPMPGSKVA